MPEDSGQSNKIQREVEKSDEQKTREDREQSHLGPNESSITQ